MTEATTHNTNAPTARISAVQEDIVRLRLTDPENQRLLKNEVVYIRPRREPEARLKAEVLRVTGDEADAQVYESTGGIALGDVVDQTGQLLSVSLGPGMLGQVYDGLQNPLEALAQGHGTFLPRGVEKPGLEPTAKWSFSSVCRIGDKVTGGDVIGTVPEGNLTHKIMVPFDVDEQVEISWIREGAVTVDEPVARLRFSSGGERTVTLSQNWPVREALPRRMLERRKSTRLYPDNPMLTRQRLIDTFFPIAQGGTACIPGPFGAGKTVLQNLISRNSHCPCDEGPVRVIGPKRLEDGHRNILQDIIAIAEITDDRRHKCRYLGLSQGPMPCYLSS